jgi:flagellin
LVGMNNLRLTGLGLQTSLERLSSGLRINRGADDPSGLAIAKVMEAQIGGVRVAEQNAQDAKSLIHTADGALNETQNILFRMRDLAVRASNQATLTTSDIRRINDEFTSLKNEIERKSIGVTFNTKVLFSGAFSGAGQVIQVGPDNGTTMKMTIFIQKMNLEGLGLSSTVAGAANIQFSSAVSAQVAITFIQSALNMTSSARASLGIQERRIDYLINDLSAEDINISAAKSRIIDADMASEISNFTRLQILQQSGTAILAQANAAPQSILQLLK